MTIHNKRIKLYKIAVACYQQADYEGVLAWVGAELGAGRNDTVHDLLAYLAERMIEMNKQKREVLEAFWLDLEGVTDGATLAGLREKGKWEQSLYKAVPSARTFVRSDSRHRVMLEASLGWNEEAFKGFVKLLVKHVSGFSRLVGVYRAHTAGVVTLEQQLAATDRLIDQAVYQLYGLTVEEIELVEQAI